MNVAIIGAGNVGGTLGKHWAKSGHDVIFGVRDPNGTKVRKILESIGKKARATNITLAVASADIIVLAVPWSAAQEVIQAVGKLEGKIVIDCTNPITENLKGLSIGPNTSAGEMVAAWAKGARIVKAFNTTGWQNMANPNYGSSQVTMFICGDDMQAKQVVIKLANELGFEVYDAGQLYAARYLEQLALLWVHLAYTEGLGPNFAFKILKR